MTASLRQRRTRDYVVRMPKDRWVKAACEQVRCDNWLYGWDTLLDERTPEGRDAAQWIRSGASGRDFRELGAADGGVTVFRFSPHQRCFTEHRTRPASWLVRAGRQVNGQPVAEARPQVVARHSGMSGWIDDLDNHVGQLADRLQKG
jgi:hypothetical protein